jgi:glycosyltransferase involved in cell wall biosynthesis
LQPGVTVAVIHPPVSVPECPVSASGDVRAELCADPSDVVILSASRLEPWKGHLNLVRALARVRATRSWKLWIAGAPQRPHEDRHLSDLRQEVSQLGLQPRVRFLGERRDVPQLMRAASLFCQPNEGPEPFGVVFAEALLCALPVVTADLGGAPEIVSDECGRLVPPGDLDALARALGELIDDAVLRARLSARGPAHAAARSAPAVVLPQIARALASCVRNDTA